MQMSRRAKRMERHHKRKNKTATLNMVSLMDIFTILVFFLLVSSSTGEVLPSTKSIKLPESTAEKKPKETLTVIVTKEHILVQGRIIATVKQVLSTKGLVIIPLQKELQLQTKRIVRRKVSSKPFNGEITIMGDQEIPYKLLKKIMVTCTKSSYGKISLAVVKKIEPEV